MNRLILINGSGAEYDLLAVSKSPTFQVEGLGYSDETEYVRIGSNYFPLEEISEQAVLTMHMLFWTSADETYKAFVSHARHDPVKILYENESGVYYIPVRLKSIEKVDKKYYSKYGCPVQFSVTGNPYKIVYGYNSGVISEGKSYGESGYVYDYTYGNDVVNTIILNSDSYIKSPCAITIYGEVINPVWRHYVNSEFAESGAYDGTIPEGHYLVIDGQSMPYSIIEYDGDGNVVADRYAKCDFSQERFFTIQEGQNLYNISHEGTDAVKMKVEAHVEYDTV